MTDLVDAARRRGRVLLVAVLAFTGLVVAAMITYRGGSHFDPLASRYAAFSNYLSDLGATVTFSGRPNGLPRVLFAAATIVVGGALAWSAPAWRVWNGRGRAPVATDVTVLGAAVAGVAFAAIGVVPQDRYTRLHIALVDVAFSVLLVFVAALAVVQVRNRAPRVLWIANVAVLAVLAADVVVVWAVPAPDVAGTMRQEIVAQKVIVVAVLVDIVLQARGLVTSPTTVATRARAPGREPRATSSVG